MEIEKLVALYKKESAEAFDGILNSGLVRAAEIIISAYESARRVWICANGGTAGIASNMAADLNLLPFAGDDKNGALEYSGFQAINLSESQSVLTAISNDTGFENVYAAQIRRFAHQHDVLFAVSGSGTSKNILAAMTAARDCEMSVIGMTRNPVSCFFSLCDVTLITPNDSAFPGQTGGNAGNMHLEDCMCKVGHMLSGILKKQAGVDKWKRNGFIV